MRTAALLILALLCAPVAIAEERVSVVLGAFEPERVEVFSWETIRWSWPEGQVHGVAPDDGGPAWCEPNAGGCASTLGGEGEHPYHCPLHPEMRGVVVVSRRGGDAAAPTRALFTVSAHGLALTFDASAVAESRLAIERYDWDFGDGTTGTGRVVTHAYAAAGTYPVTLTVLDETGNTSTTTRFVHAEPTGDTMARFGWEVAQQTLVVEAMVSEGEHAWDFGDGARGNGSTSAHTYVRAGEFLVTHTLVLANGTFVMTDHVLAESEATFDATPDGLSVRLDASRLPHYGNASYEWRFGDTSNASGETVTHAFAEPGEWSVALTLTDARGSVELARAIAVDASSAAAPAPSEPAREASAAPVLAVLTACLLALLLRPETYK